MKINIIKIPFEGGALGKNSGCSKSPDLIVEMLSEMLDEEGNTEKISVKEIDLEKNNFQKSHEKISEEIKNNKTGIIIGGDHSITYSAFKSSSCDGMIVLDAHPDMMYGTDLPSHEDFLRKLIEEKHLKASNIILFGTRSWHEQELGFIKENNIKFFSMKQIFEFGIKEMTDTLMENARRFNNLYVSLDIDVVDPAFAPGTGYQEPGGLSSREIIYIIQRIKHLKNIRFFDVMEVNGMKDRDNITIKLAAKVIREMGRVI